MALALTVLCSLCCLPAAGNAVSLTAAQPAKPIARAWPVAQDAVLAAAGGHALLYVSDHGQAITWREDAFGADAPEGWVAGATGEGVATAIAHLEAISTAYWSGHEAVIMTDGPAELQWDIANITSAISGLPSNWTVLQLGDSGPLRPQPAAFSADLFRPILSCEVLTAWPANPIGYAVSRRGAAALLGAFWPGGRLLPRGRQPSDGPAQGPGKAGEPSVIDLRLSARGPFTACSFFAPLLAGGQAFVLSGGGGGSSVSSGAMAPLAEENAGAAAAAAATATEAAPATRVAVGAAAAAAAGAAAARPAAEPALTVAFSPGAAYAKRFFKELLASAFPGRIMVFRGGADGAETQRLLCSGHTGDYVEGWRRQLEEAVSPPDLLILTEFDCGSEINRNGGCLNSVRTWSRGSRDTVVMQISGEPWLLPAVTSSYADVLVTTLTDPAQLPPPPLEPVYISEAAVSFVGDHRQFATPLDLLGKAAPGFDAAAVAAGKDWACAYQYSGCYAPREAFFDLLSARIPVHAVGACHGSLPDDSPLWQPDNTRTADWFKDRSVEVLKRYRFAIASEAAVLDGYVTEKLVNPMLANTIPIYLGSGTASQYFNTKSYFDCRLFASLAACADAVAAMEANATAYSEMLSEPWILPEKLEELFSWHPAVPGDATARKLAAALRRARQRKLQARGELPPAWQRNSCKNDTAN